MAITVGNMFACCLAETWGRFPSCVAPDQGLDPSPLRFVWGKNKCKMYGGNWPKIDSRT